MVVAPGFPDDDPNLNILDILISKGAITPDQRELILNHLENWAGDLESTMNHLGFASQEFIGMARAKLYDLQWFDFSKHSIDAEAANLVPKSIIRYHQVFPVVCRGDKLFIAISDPESWSSALKDVRNALKVESISPQPVLASKLQLQAAVAKYFEENPEI